MPLIPMFSILITVVSGSPSSPTAPCSRYRAGEIFAAKFPELKEDVPSEYRSPFADIADRERSSIDPLVFHEVMSGRRPKYFDGKEPFSRYQLVSVVVRVKEFVQKKGASSLVARFDTSDTHWAYKALQTLKKDGILVGYPDGSFRGERQASEYEVTAVAQRLRAFLAKKAKDPATS